MTYILGNYGEIPEYFVIIIWLVIIVAAAFWLWIASKLYDNSDDVQETEDVKRERAI